MKVFLSYSSADREVAVEIAERLRRAGFTTWEPTTSVFPGDNWALAHGRALEHADVFVALLSPDSVKSPAVSAEIGFALATKRFAGKLIPVRVRDTHEAPWIMDRFPTLHAVGGNREHGIGALVALLKKLEPPSSRARRARRPKRVPAREAL